MSLRDLIEKELALSEQIIRDGHELVPRFTVFMADGDETVFVPMKEDPLHRAKRMQLMRNYFVWRMATGFIMSCELKVPDAVVSVFVGMSGAAGVMREIERDPISEGSEFVAGRDYRIESGNQRTEARWT